MDKAIEAAARALCQQAGDPDHYWAMYLFEATAAIEAAAPLIRAEERREIVVWLRRGDTESEVNYLADAIERGDHRKGDQ